MSEPRNSESQANDQYQNLVSYLLERFEQSQEMDRVRVLKALSYYEEQEVTDLAIKLVREGTPDDEVATAALKLLARQGNTAVIPVVREIVAEHGIPATWLLCLGRIGTAEARDIIQQYLRHYRGTIRGAAMYAMAIIAREDDIALEILSSLADDKTSVIRSDAIQALSTAGERAHYILLSLIHSEPLTATKAIRVPGNMQSELAVPHLIPLLLEPATSTEPGDLVIEVLQKIATPAALDALNAHENSRKSQV